MERTDMPALDFLRVGGRYWVNRKTGDPWYKTTKRPATYARVDDPNEQSEAILATREVFVKNLLRDMLNDMAHMPPESLQRLLRWATQQHTGDRYDSIPSGPVRNSYASLMELIEQVGRYDRVGKQIVNPSVVRPKR